MPAPPDPHQAGSVNAYATPRGVFLEVRSHGVSILAAVTVHQVGSLVAALQAAAATARAMAGDLWECPRCGCDMSPGMGDAPGQPCFDCMKKSTDRLLRPPQDRPL